MFFKKFLFYVGVFLCIYVCIYRGMRMSIIEYNGFELVVWVFKELNVKYIFGYFGGFVFDLYDVLF